MNLHSGARSCPASRALLIEWGDYLPCVGEIGCEAGPDCGRESEPEPSRDGLDGTEHLRAERRHETGHDVGEAVHASMFSLLGSCSGSCSVRVRFAHGEPRTKNIEPGTEPEHEPRSEKMEG